MGEVRIKREFLSLYPRAYALGNGMGVPSRRRCQHLGISLSATGIKVSVRDRQVAGNLTGMLSKAESRTSIKTVSMMSPLHAAVAHELDQALTERAQRYITPTSCIIVFECDGHPQTDRL